jgi:hypothetical protein
MEKEINNDLPFKIGDKFTVKSKPQYWSFCDGKAQYPLKLDFPIKNRKVVEITKSLNYISIFDGTYGWNYEVDIFEKIEEEPIPEYVECINWIGDLYKTGRIYKVDKLSNDIDPFDNHGHCFKPSTKEAYLNNLVKEIDILFGL